MKPWVRVTAAALAVGLTLPVLALGTATAASAASFDDIIDLFNYKLLKSATELQAAMGPAAAAAWGPETARVATRSASAYNIAAATSGIAEIVPDAVVLRPQDLPNVVRPNGLKNYVTKYSGVGLDKPTGVVGAAVAMTAFQYRVDWADGVASWLGIDAESAVCGDPVASGGFVNFVTGQDCSAFKLSAEFAAQANADAQEGFTTNICDPSGHCYEYTGTVTNSFQNSAWCFAVDTGTPNVQTVFLREVGSTAPAVVSNIRGNASNAYAAQCAAEPGGTHSIYGGAWLGTPLPTLPPNMFEFSFVDPAVGAVWQESEYSDGNPLRWWVCDLTGDDGNHYTATSDSFREGDTTAVPVVCSNLPPGVESVHMKITEVGGPEPIVFVDDDALPDPLGDGSDTAGVTTAYCDEFLCVLELMDLRSNRSCFDEGDACDGWMQSPTRDADFKCFYGGVAQDFRQCYAYAHVFNTAKRLAGNPYADPKTGEDLGTKSGLSIDELTMANAPRPAAFGRNCFGGDWGASNPINWVLRPIQCALEWAFAARPEVVTANAEVVQSAWQNTAPGEVVEAVGAWGFPAGSTGCAGPAVNIPFFGLTGHPLSACEGTMLAPLAGPVKTILSVLLVFGGAFVIVRLVAGVIGYRGIDG